MLLLQFALGLILSPSQNECTCPFRFWLNTTSVQCEACPYDCYTCTSSGNCLSCNSTHDFRQLDQNTSRCVPIPGYFESNVTVSGQCSLGCMTCTSPTQCSVCLPRYLFNASTLSCDSCPYDCYTCDVTGNCLSCNSSIDHRVLSVDNTSTRCVPAMGYF